MAEKTYTTFNIAQLLDVDPSTVTKWIDKGLIEAYTTPGGHRRVLVSKLRGFLLKSNIPIPEELIETDKGNKQKKILVVDDDPQVLESLTKVLETLGDSYQIISAIDGFEAGRIVSIEKPDLIVLDVMLPGLDGIKVCELVKKELPETGVIAITGFNSKENKKRMLEAGADLFLSKPFDFHQFLQDVIKLSK